MADLSAPLDRISPATRPHGPNAGTQRWRELLFVHWTAPIEAVRPLVPPALELDAWDGRAWIGAVPFRMEEIRPSWLPKIAALDFLELNLRTYVHHRGRPGVWFFSLEASSWLAVRAARAMWSLPYHHAHMSTTRRGQAIDFASVRRRGGARFECEYEVGEPLGASAPGTLEHFLLERYLLFADRAGWEAGHAVARDDRAGRILEGQVHHPPYPVHRVRLDRVEDGLRLAAGLPDGPVEAVHWSPGVDVEVFGPR